MITQPFLSTLVQGYQKVFFSMRKKYVLLWGLLLQTVTPWLVDALPELLLLTAGWLVLEFLVHPVHGEFILSLF